MSYYKYVYNDKEIIELYNKISLFEDNDVNGIAYHNFDHVSNVVTIVEKLLCELKYNSSFIDEAKIAAVLHDVGCLEGKKDHSERSYNFAKEYLRKKNIKLENEVLVLEAIRLHSDGFDTDNIMALVLILADKLDIKYTRLTKRGYKVIGMRQLQYIKDILVDIENGVLRINFICDNEIDKKELEEYYFIFKIFNSINAFANKMNIVPEVFINNESWSAFFTEKKKKYLHN